MVGSCLKYRLLENFSNLSPSKCALILKLVLITPRNSSVRLYVPAEVFHWKISRLTGILSWLAWTGLAYCRIDILGGKGKFLIAPMLASLFIFAYSTRVMLASYRTVPFSGLIHQIQNAHFLSRLIENSSELKPPPMGPELEKAELIQIFWMSLLGRVISRDVTVFKDFVDKAFNCRRCPMFTRIHLIR